MSVDHRAARRRRRPTRVQRTMRSSSSSSSSNMRCTAGISKWSSSASITSELLPWRHMSSGIAEPACLNRSARRFSIAASFSALRVGSRRSLSLRTNPPASTILAISKTAVHDRSAAFVNAHPRLGPKMDAIASMVKT